MTMTADELIHEVMETKARLEQLNYSVNSRINHMVNEMMRIENNVEDAVSTLLHEIIEYLRHNDIQALDEAEFSSRLRELLKKEPELPF